MPGSQVGRRLLKGGVGDRGRPRHWSLTLDGSISLDEMERRILLRDKPAIDRTSLANERTLLSWLRTALILLISGATLLKLFDGVLAMQIVGAILISIGLVTRIFGLLHYRKTRVRISATRPN